MKSLCAQELKAFLYIHVQHSPPLLPALFKSEQSCNDAIL